MPNQSVFSFRDSRYFLQQAKKSQESAQLNAALYRTTFAHQPLASNHPRYKTTTQKVIAALLFTQAIVSLVNISPEKETLMKETINNKPIKDISSQKTTCQPKPSGVSYGKVCTISGIFKDTTYYMKEIRQNAPPTSLLEEYNRQFVKSNIGINVPITHFFHEKKDKITTYFIASEKVEDLILARNFHAHPHAKAIAQRDIAKLVVAFTFINDLHSSNWGVDKNGIILIDVDSNGWQPSSMQDCLNHASELNRWLIFSDLNTLSLTNIIEIRDLYKEMLKQPQPPHHLTHQISSEEYKKLLSIYINSCNQVIQDIKKKHPNRSESEQSKDILEKLVESFKHAARSNINSSSYKR